MNNPHCLNCEKELTDRFCSGCGQKADTHRISFRNFVFHDVLHGTFHLEKGILFTARQALLRPGRAALDYISGKRKRYYNVFYLILITFGFILFLRHFYGELSVLFTGEAIAHQADGNDASKTINDILARKSKLIVFLFVPFAALNSQILFRRKKLNLSEHAIRAGMILLGMLLLSAIGNLLFYFNLFCDDSSYLPSIINIATPSLILLYIAYGYFNAFAQDYSKWGMGGRIVLFFALLVLEVLLLTYLLIGFATHWEFGEVTISPFG